MKNLDLCSTVGLNSEVVCNDDNLISYFVIFTGVYPVFVYSCHKNKLSHQAVSLNIY
jgi:hypothetical protein